MPTTPNNHHWPDYLPVWDEPVAEGLQGASCSAECKAIAAYAALAWERGESAEQWRDGLLSDHHAEIDLRMIAEAQECMRSSGLWPWNP